MTILAKISRKRIKRTLSVLFGAFLLFSVSLAEEPTSEHVVSVLAESKKEVQGFVLPNSIFFGMDQFFRQADFSGELASVVLSETQTLIFNSKKTDHLLPNLTVTLTEAKSFTEDVDTLVSALGSLIGTMQYLQEQFPEEFLFNEELFEQYDDVGVSYAVAEPEIWLWQESARAVFIPVCFYENENGTLIDNMYLLEVVAADKGTLSYILYNDPQCVMDYMAHVTVSADGSPFQQALVFWYLQNHLLADEGSTDVADSTIGMVRITNEDGFIRYSNDANSRVVKHVQQGEEYPVLSVEGNGWYKVLCEDGKGYISSKVVEFFESKARD